MLDPKFFSFKKKQVGLTQGGGYMQGGIKYFTSWEPILLAENFARNSGSQTRQMAFKIAVIWVLIYKFIIFP